MSKILVRLLFLLIFTNPLQLKAQSSIVDFFTPHRISIGSVSRNTDFSSNIEEEEKSKMICVTDSPRDEESIRNNDEIVQCDNGGFDSYKEPTIFSGSIEFHPTYFGDTGFGASLFFSGRNLETTLLDYPLVNEKTDLIFESYSVNPNIFYTLGDNDLGRKSGIAVRLGFGYSFHYIQKFELTRRSTGEKYTVEKEFNTFNDDTVSSNLNIFFDFNWSFFYFRLEGSTIIFGDKKFDDVNKDLFLISSSYNTLGVSYYF